MLVVHFELSHRQHGDPVGVASLRQHHADGASSLANVGFNLAGRTRVVCRDGALQSAGGLQERTDDVTHEGSLVVGLDQLGWTKDGDEPVQFIRHRVG